MRNFRGVDLEIAADGQEALNVLFAIAPIVPALAILDIKMPKMSGLEALCVIRSTDGMAAIPIVMYSSSDEPKDVAEAERCKATEYVLKPIDPDKYIEIVRHLVVKYVVSDLL